MSVVILKKVLFPKKEADYVSDETLLKYRDKVY